jgi:4-amino-4-deoxy-L-arabinose transferase-like glycosyltransferase
VWSRALAPGYLDHPPMVALWIGAGTALAGDTALGVRLAAPLAAALGSLLLVQAGEDLIGAGSGLLAAVLLNATLLFGIGAVTMTPDTPLLFFWTVALWATGRLAATGRGGWWLVAGAAAGLALDSKYTAAFLPVGLLLWLLATPSLRPWLRRWEPWAGAALGLVLFAPVLLWNAAHDWASFAKQGGRAADWTAGRAGQFLGELLGGQIALATPLLALLFAAGWVVILRRAWRERSAGPVLLAALTVPALLLFGWHALGDRVQANWPSLLYPALALAAAGLGAGWRRLILPAVGLGLVVTLVVWVQGALAPFALPMRLDPTLLRLGGWPVLAAELDAIGQREDATFIATDNYGQAALLGWLLPPGVPVLGVEGRWALFGLPDGRPLLIGRRGLLLRSARRDDRPEPQDWVEITPLPGLVRSRDGMTAEAYRLYRVVGRAGSEPAAVMPRRLP